MDDVRGATETPILRYHPQHRHWRFRRQSFDIAQNKAVEHQIAHHQQVRAFESCENLEKVGHRNKGKLPLISHP